MTNTMKRHTSEQVVRKLGQADRMLGDGADVAQKCRELGVSGADVLPVAEPVRRPQGRRSQTPQATREAERHPQAAAG